MSKKIKIWIAIFALMVGAGLVGCTILDTLQGNPEAVVQSSSLETAVARTGDLTILASGSGEVVPASEIGLTFSESGVVIEMLASVGQQVKAGDVLARLQTDKTQAELAAEIAAVRLAVVQDQQELDSLYANAAIETAKALIEMEDARMDLEDRMDLELEKALAMEAIAQSQEDIEEAEMLLYIYNSSPSESDLYTAYASLLFKEIELDRVQSELEKAERKIKGVKDPRMRARYEDQILQLKVLLANQQIVVENATYKLDTMDDRADPLDVTVVEAQLRTAEAQLAAAQSEWVELQSGPDPGVIAVAEARFKQAQANWETLKDGPDPGENARLETQLENARLSLEILQSDPIVVDLVAPIDGKVITVNANVGDRHNPVTGTSSAATGTTDPHTEIESIEAFLFGNQSSTANNDSSLITIADLNQPLLEAYIDETDFNKVAIGYPVEVAFDALQGETFIGEIVEISPILEMVSNAQAVRILVRLDANSYAKPVTLPMGLNASVDVIAGQVKNAVLIPVEALVEVGPEEYAVYVVEDNQTQRRDVSIGLIDFTSVEIIDGITAGDVVAIGYANTTGN